MTCRTYRPTIDQPDFTHVHPGLAPDRISADEFLETLRRRVLIPVVDSGAVDVRLSVAPALPSGIDAAAAGRLWASTLDRLLSLPSGSRVLVRVSAQAGDPAVEVCLSATPVALAERF